MVDCSVVVILKLYEIIHSLFEVEEEIEVLEAGLRFDMFVLEKALSLDP